MNAKKLKNILFSYLKDNCDELHGLSSISIDKNLSYFCDDGSFDANCNFVFYVDNVFIDSFQSHKSAEKIEKVANELKAFIQNAFKDIFELRSVHWKGLNFEAIYYHDRCKHGISVSKPCKFKYVISLHISQNNNKNVS